MLNLRNHSFWGSAVNKGGWPKDNLPEVAVVGRSNVGKSSFINQILGAKNAAKISSKPGKTRLINFFRIDNRLYLVDLPGYGFTRLPKSEQQKWKIMIEEYLEQSKNLRLVVLLVDGRHKTFRTDVEMKHWLDHFGIPVQILATKADKLSKSKINSVWQQNSTDFGLRDGQMPIFFSAITGMGKKEIIKILENTIT